jgi:hypothetical protein
MSDERELVNLSTPHLDILKSHHVPGGFSKTIILGPIIWSFQKFSFLEVA